MMGARHPGCGRQRGVAVITALLLTTLAVTIVASLFWQQQVQVRSMENQRLHLQTQWAVRGMVDYARFWLRQDNPNLTALDGVWATPIEEAQLDDYVDRERVEGEKFNATVSGRATDAQARYNLTNLASNKTPNAGQLLAFQRLLSNLQLDSGLAQAAADMMVKAQVVAAPGTPLVTPPAGTPVAPAASGAASGADSEPLGLTQVEDLLAVPGFTPQVLARLRDFVIVLPQASDVNVNTAPAEVLAAVTDMSLAQANALVVTRQRTKFMDVANFKSNLPAGKTVLAGVGVNINSSYFLTSILVRLDRAVLDAQALVWRQNNPQRLTSLIWIREY